MYDRSSATYIRPSPSHAHSAGHTTSGSLATSSRWYPGGSTTVAASSAGVRMWTSTAGSVVATSPAATAAAATAAAASTVRVIHRAVRRIVRLLPPRPLSYHALPAPAAVDPVPRPSRPWACTHADRRCPVDAGQSGAPAPSGTPCPTAPASRARPTRQNPYQPPHGLPPPRPGTVQLRCPSILPPQNRATPAAATGSRSSAGLAAGASGDRQGLASAIHFLLPSSTRRIYDTSYHRWRSSG